MPTPNTYDFENFKTILNGSSNLFHQTSITNLPSILAQGVIFAPGTQWGVSPNSTTTRYTSNTTRLRNLKLIASRGFIDYVFCSFENGIQRRSATYGLVSIEVNSKILLERESFIYPFNFVFGWGGATLSDKFSDLSTWNAVISNANLAPYNEVLIRRKIEVAGNLVKFHCFQGVAAKVLLILRQAGYNEDDLVIHPNIASRRFMETERLVEIEGIEYKALVSADGRLASVYNIVSADDLDFLGRFSVNGDKLVEFYPMSNQHKVIGTFKAEANSQQA